MVRPACAADMDQLANKVNRGLTRLHDVLVGDMRCPLWRLQHHPEFQCPNPGPTAVLHGAMSRQLGPGPFLRPRMARLDRGDSGCCRCCCVCRHRGCLDPDLAGRCCLNIIFVCYEVEKTWGQRKYKHVSAFSHGALPRVFTPVEN